MDVSNSIRKNFDLTKKQMYLSLVIGIVIIFYMFAYNTIQYSSSSTLSFHLNKDDCMWEFDHYSPSSWELYWYNNISYLQDQVCSTLLRTDQKRKSIRTLEYIMDLQKRIYNESIISKEYDELFSKMYYRYKCTSSSQSNNPLVSQYIEPLVGLLRDPLTICTYDSLPPNLRLDNDFGVQSKRFYLLGPSAPYQNFQSPTKSIAPWLYHEGSQKILLDIGSSLFNGLGDDLVGVARIGAKWFYEYFRRSSLRFDRILTFDIDSYTQKKYWDEVPADLMGILTFIGVSVEYSGKLNPWNILKTIAKVDDYVIIKLDIDTPHLENALIAQILEDKAIFSLIDEMFFEMHVTVNDMTPYWGSPGGQLNDSYVLFNRLRRLGIRMHSWP